MPTMMGKWGILYAKIVEKLFVGKPLNVHMNQIESIFFDKTTNQEW